MMKQEFKEQGFGYQIYIKSFFDSNNDGIGDLNGIRNKLKYIKSLGVNFIWICPFYDSPMEDNGYDIRDYYKVDEVFGTNEDLKLLINEAHALGIKVFLDLVTNHTSSQNEWFIKSEQRIDPYTDFYIWKDGKIAGEKTIEPNNWESVFSGSAWKYSDTRKQYYLHLFAEHMPDLNYDNKKVFEEIEKILKFYANLNVDGFRVDAIAHIGKDLTFKDAKDPKKSYKHFSNLKTTHTYLKEFHKMFDKYNLISMGELGGTPSTKDLISYSAKDELDMIFSFEHLNSLTNDYTIDINTLYKSLKYKVKISNKGWSVLFWLNHDYPRLLSKIKKTSDAKNNQLVLATLMYFLKGTPLIYNGEELGMENYDFSSIDEFKDINAKMIYENAIDKEKAFYDLKETSRDNSRTTMPWNTTKNAGFSKHEVWSYVVKNYKECNVKVEQDDLNSMLNNYKNIIRIRNEYSKMLTYGKYCFHKRKSLIGYKVKYEGKTLQIIANLGENKANIRTKDAYLLYSNKEFKDSSLNPAQVIVFTY